MQLEDVPAMTTPAHYSSEQRAQPSYKCLCLVPYIGKVSRKSNGEGVVERIPSPTVLRGNYIIIVLAIIIVTLDEMKE